MALLKKLLRLLPDRIYIQLMYYKHFKKFANLNAPQTFNEKLQWLKLNDRNAKYIQMVDKFQVKEYVKEKIGEEYIIPTLAVYDDVDLIKPERLPEAFVLKCTHDSGSVAICKDKSSFDFNKAKEKLAEGLKRNGYWYGREWPYKNVKPRIIAEAYLEDGANETGQLTDYKFFCFDGKVDCVMVCIDRYIQSPTKFYFFDENWKLLKYNYWGINAPENLSISKPEKLSKMIEIAETLSKDIPFVRIDLYYSNESIYFGEITFYPDSGFDENILPEQDRYFGELIKVI